MTRKAASTKDQIHLITFKGVAYTTVPLVRIELSLGPQLGNAFLVLLELGLELRYHVRGDGLLRSGSAVEFIYLETTAGNDPAG